MADETGTLTQEAAPPPDRAVTTDWRASLPEDLRAEKSLESFKDIGALAKSYVETKQLVGTKLPEGLTTETVSEYLKRKAEDAPESPDKYSIKAPTFDEKLGIEWDASRQARMLAKMHTLGASNRMVQGLIDAWAEETVATRTAEAAAYAAESKAARDASAKALHERWGAAYDQNLRLAYDTVEKYFKGNERLRTALLEEGNNPDLLEGLVEIGRDMFERGEVRGDAPGIGRTPDDLRAEINAIRDDPKNAGSLAAGDKIHALTTALIRLEERLKR